MATPPGGRASDFPARRPAITISELPETVSVPFAVSREVDPYSPEPGHEHLYPASCTVVLSVHSHYTILGGTGEYRHATGSGRSDLEFTAVTGRDYHGNCDLKRILPWSARAYFDASGPLGFES